MSSDHDHQQPGLTEAGGEEEIGAIVLPVSSLIQGATFWATKPPRLPTELMAAMPAAAMHKNTNFSV